MRLFLDITRIATRTVRSTPTGIDRTEFAYAKEILFNRPDIETTPVLTTPAFTGAITASLARTVLSKVEESWRTPVTPENDVAFQRLKPLLQEPPDPQRNHATRVQGRRLSQVIRKGLMFPVGELLTAPARLRREVDALRGRPAAYLHTSHTQLQQARRFRWTAGQVKPVFFLHDMIPVDFPEYCSPGSAARHLGRLQTVAQIADLIVVNSTYTAERARFQLSRQGWRQPPISVVPLGVEDIFLNPPADAPLAPERPYFVYVGTIEPRKNLAFLLAVWRQIVEQCGDASPRLVIVGRRGWENESVVDMLERSRQIAPYVIEVADLADRSLVTLLKGAAALISPSFVEGFGLPLVEASALGTPLIVSEIAAHREVATNRATFVDPNDGPAWIAAIRSHAMNRTPMEAGRTPHDTWPNHVRETLAAIAQILA
jgi:glycosyltransferase involved in cell wall biosynthesis